MPNQSITPHFFRQIVEMLETARKGAIRAINKQMVLVYYNIGRMIVEEEQRGEDRAEYGKRLMRELSRILTDEFGKGFSITNLQQMRSFYMAYRIQQTPSVNSTNVLEKNSITLSWSHYLTLMRIDDLAERQFYEIEAAKNNWSVRELKRLIEEK